MTTNFPTGAVVVGVDGSDQSHAAIDKAAELAQLEHRPLQLLHAERIPVFVHPAYSYGLDNLPALVRGASQYTAQQALEYATATYPDLSVAVSIIEDDPREALEHASHAASAVVIGSRGLGGIRSLLLGSVSLWVSQHAACPILVVRPQVAGDEAPIIVGTDGAEVSAGALEFAFAQASARRSRLIVVHCYDEGSPGGYGLTGMPDEDLEGHTETRRAIRESIAGLREKFLDVDVDFEPSRGSAARYLTHASERAQMLVIGSHQRSAASALFSGTVSRPVVEHAKCTVAVVPAHSAREA